MRFKHDRNVAELHPVAIQCRRHGGPYFLPIDLRQYDPGLPFQNVCEVLYVRSSTDWNIREG